MAREKIIWVCFKEALSWEDTPGSIREVMVGWLSLGCGKYDSKSFFFLCYYLVGSLESEK
jgi:hypothetical protein